MRKLINKLIKEQDGAVIIIVALFMTILIGFAALVLDVGLAYNKKAELQKDMDSIALAAVRELPAASTASTDTEWSKAVASAIKYAQMNGISDLTVAENIQPRREDESDSTSRIIGLTISDSVEVNYNFANIFGFKSGTAKCDATAKLEPASSVSKLLPLALPDGIYKYLKGNMKDDDGNPIILTGDMTLKLGPQKDTDLDPQDIRSEFAEIFEQLFLDATGKNDIDNSDDTGKTSTSTGGWRGAINFSEHGNEGNYQKAMKAGGFPGDIKLGEEVTLNNGTMTINSSPIIKTGIYAVPVIAYQNGALRIIDVCSIQITDIPSKNKNDKQIKILVAEHYTGTNVVSGTVYGMKKNSNDVLAVRLTD